MLPHSGPLSPTLPAALLPLAVVALDLVMAYYFAQDLYQPERRVSGGDKTVWLFIIVFGSVVGCLAYLLIGRES